MGSITVDVLEGGYVVANSDGDAVVFTSKSKVLKYVKEYLESFELTKEQVELAAE